MARRRAKMKLRKHNHLELTADDRGFLIIEDVWTAPKSWTSTEKGDQEYRRPPLILSSKAAYRVANWIEQQSGRMVASVDPVAENIDFLEPRSRRTDR